MNKQLLIAGNWKMHMGVGESREFVLGLARSFRLVPGMTVAVFPPFVALAGLRGLDGKIKIGAQNMFHEDQGAFTGEVSPLMLRDLVDFVLVGHSERRQLFNETNDLLNKKLKAALRHGLSPILCVGETLQEREAGETMDRIGTQLERGLQGVPEEGLARTTVAYEPIWAIGTGRNATPAQAQEVHHFIRRAWSELAPGVGPRILYGGSVKPENSRELLAQDDVSGVLVGGASLKIESFSAIIQAGAQLLEQ
jgi:triosephosphate isomerase